MAAALTSKRLVLLCLLASLLLLSSGILSWPGAMADAQVEDLEEEEVDVGGRNDFESAEGGGTEVEISGEDVEESEEELQLEAAPGVETSAIFPNLKLSGKMPGMKAGQQQELLFGISNQGVAPLKITAVVSKLYVPYDYRLVAQNFTGELPSNVTVINATVPRGSQSSFAFHFTPLKLLQPMAFGFATNVFYEVEGMPYVSVIFNNTVDILEPSGVVAGESVFLVLLAVGVLALLGMWASTQLESLSKRAKKSKKVETGSGDDGDAAANNEWLQEMQGTFFNPNQGKGGQAGKRRGTKR